MSINVYLDGNKVAALARPLGSAPRSTPLDNFRVEKGTRARVVLYDIFENFPKDLQEFATDISLLEKFDSIPKRIIGRYRHGAATGMLDVKILASENGFYKIYQFEGKIPDWTNWADLQNLYLMVRSGKIKPDENWEESQKID